MTPLKWGIAGAFLGAALGAGYGMWLYYSPEYREAYIQKTLAQPHMDSQRYLVSVLAWRYRTLESLILQYAPAGALLGFGIGATAGHWRKKVLDPPIDDSKAPEAGFHLWEAVTVFSITGFLVLSLLPINRGLVHYEGKDQCDWLMQLEFGNPSQKREAVIALSVLLERPPFPCRSTIVPALGEAGEIAKPALPVLRDLTDDQEVPVRNAAKKALTEIEQAVVQSGRDNNH